MTRDYQVLVHRAKEVLEGNWMGSATKPAPKLYPHQWSWDSAFVAIGYSHFNQKRAQQELVSLFQGQWNNGMLPHIIFNPEAADYKPGPEFWQTDRSSAASRKPLTSGIIQPPIHATAVRHIYDHGQDRQEAQRFVEELFPKLKRWHEYLYNERNPDQDGLLYIRHPWESGQDNSPIWDRILERIKLKQKDIPEYRRVDTTLVASGERPSDAEYDRYAYLVKIAYDHGYEEARIRRTCPVLVKDVLFNTIAVRANRDLAALAEVVGEEPKPFREWADLTCDHLNKKLWSNKGSIYFDYDMVRNRLIRSHVAAGFTPLFAHVPSRERAIKICDRLNTNSFCRLDEVCLAVPSYDKKSLDSQRIDIGAVRFG